MTRLFLLSGGVHRDPGIDAWFAEQTGELRGIARAWFDRLRGCGDDVRELMHDGCPVVCVQDAAFAYVNAFKAHVNLGFYQGAVLDDPAGLLLGDGKLMRHVKLRPGEAPDARALNALVAAAYRDVRSRLGSA